MNVERFVGVGINSNDVESQHVVGDFEAAFEEPFTIREGHESCFSLVEARDDVFF